MKFLIISLSAAVISFLLAAGMVFLLVKVSKRGINHTKRERFLEILSVWIALYIFGGIGYFSIYTHCGQEAMEALESDERVTISEIERAWLFDGPGTDEVLVFYPGAKVDEKAYAPLCRRLAENGIDCIVVKMPLHMAFTDRAAGERYRSQYDYVHWYLGGHSLGGAMAAAYAAQDKTHWDGLVLLAAYSVDPLPQMKCCSVYGDQDGVMNREQYDAGKSYWPEGAKQLVIAGGNHAQFGDYGAQRGDGTATITAEEQVSLTADFIEFTLK